MIVCVKQDISFKYNQRSADTSQNAKRTFLGRIHIHTTIQIEGQHHGWREREPIPSWVALDVKSHVDSQVSMWGAWPTIAID
ncbi:hypothetical protein L484_010606 [Morus notabilis]|uniref:Uncharacterized protein n=1 Tax=Morus notabilis TaxID=981085 RepID=W9QL06_9ROSA|nr:hypothetical protein L484_010606 [Morus notabilis]